MGKKWLANVGLILLVVFAVFLTGYYAGESPTGFAPQGARPVCGNGVVEAREQCDDGNTARGDGCFRCRRETGRVPGICGDGVLNLREECDDSNIIRGDGCSERCLSESSTWQCNDRDNFDGDEGEETTNIWFSNYVQTRRSSSERWTITDRDRCLDPNTLREFWCHPTDDRPTAGNVNCEYGCSNGACNPLPCSDTDGNDILTSGSVTGVFRGSYNGRGADPAVLGLSPSAQTYEDGCWGMRVREWTCASNGFVSVSLRDCSSGRVCNDGRCTELPQTPLPPVLVETACDGIDNDGDGVIDEGCDDDNDGVCDPSMEFVSSTCGAGIYPWNSNCCHTGGDCNDNDAWISPWRSENCYRSWGVHNGDGLDNNCDGIVDEGCETTCDDTDNDGNGLVDDGCDNDGDGYCSSSHTIVGTPAVCPNGGGDCYEVHFVNIRIEEHRERAASVNPGEVENCFDNNDNNCNGQSNENCGPFTCTESGDSTILTSATGQSQNYVINVLCWAGGLNTTNNCITPTPEFVEGDWRRNNYGSYFMRSTWEGCPAGTTCSDPDGSAGPIFAVCS